MTRETPKAQPSTLAVDQEVAERVRDTARRADMTVKEVTTLLLQWAIDEGIEVDRPPATIRRKGEGLDSRKKK